MEKKCPKCRALYGELDNYCRKCGIALEKAKNRCSDEKTTRCSHLTFADDDVYCPACGSLTVCAAKHENKN